MALNLPKLIQERRSLRSLKRTDRYLNSGTRKIFFFSDNIMAFVAGKWRTTALFLSATVTCTRRHAELTNLMGNLCCAREHSVQFLVQFFYTVKHSLTHDCMGPFTLYTLWNQLIPHKAHVFLPYLIQQT